MYKVLKEKGHNENVILENTDTKASLVIGKLTIAILDILRAEGHEINTTDKDCLQLVDQWDLPVSEEGKAKLEKLAMRMNRPIKEKKPTEEKVEEKKNNKNIDAMDVLLGLASYN